MTDRPDFTESTDAIPTGHAQLEMGYTFTLDRESKTRARSHTAPEFLLRLGVASNLELRLGWEGYHWSETLAPGHTRAGRPVRREEWNQGASDVSIGIKYKFAEQDGTRPHMGIIAALTAPSGSANISGGDVEPEVVFLWAYDVDDRLSIAGNAGFVIPSDDGDRFAQGKASLSFAYAVTDRLGAYLEYFGLYPSALHSDAAHSVNGGVTYLISDNFQLDARVGAGLNEEADDFFTGIGFAVRW
ncbi:MAG: transporter [Planctomycetes bacterium]|nr:transporter [Planctomycetota bacterium]